MQVERQDIIEQFFQMIRSLQQHKATDLILVREFFLKLSDIRHFTPPTVELLNVLKFHQPSLFYDFQSSLMPDSAMSILASVHTDIEVCIQSLQLHSREALKQALLGDSTELHEKTAPIPTSPLG
jgi:hypothetical protein